MQRKVNPTLTPTRRARITCGRLVLAATAVAAVLFAPALHADTWNEKTIMKFSSPVMVPNATLPPGTYVFRIGDFTASRHIVRIYTEDEQRLITTTQAVPTRRVEANDDIVVMFSPTEAGAAPAVKGWYYPGTLYGHEFIYPEEQARHIADRTKTLVLSGDIPDSAAEKGTIEMLDASGKRAPWNPDAATQREWDQWRKSHDTQSASGSGTPAATQGTPSSKTSGDTSTAAGSSAQAKTAAGSSADANAPNAARGAADRPAQATAELQAAPGASSVPLARSAFEGKRVELDALEDNPSQFIGQKISVDAEVENVYGPRLFTIDERNWGDLDGEILVLMPTTLGALVREGDQVTVSGTVRPFIRAEVEREWGWFDLEPETEIDIARKPVLVAERIVGGDNNVAMVIEVGAPGDRAVGTSGASATGKPVMDLQTIARGDTELVGRHVELSGVQVAGAAKDGHGFFAESAGRRVFVLPSPSADGKATAGAAVDITGVVMQMPHGMQERLGAAGTMNDDIYIFASSIDDRQ